MKKIFLLSAVLVMLAVLVSCSSVFSAGLTGTLTDADDDNVAVVGATVYAYTNKSTRDSLYQKYLNDNANLTDVDFAKYASNAISVGKSDAKGEYSLSRAVWHSSSPKYGKTADVTNFYLIIYHEDYCLTTKDIPGVTSDSTNLHVGDEKLLPSKEVTNVTYKINDVGVEGAVFSDTCTMKYVVTSTDPEGKTYDLPVEEISATGTGVVRVKYPIGNTDVKVKFQLVANGSSWKQTDNTGAYKTWTDPVDVKTTKDKVKNLSMENVLYLKNHEFNMPLFKGYVGTGAMSTDGGDTADDGVTLYLASSTDGANFTVYEGSGVTTSVRVERPSMGDDKYYHGYFDGLGAGIKWKTENYDGKFCTTDKIYIVKLDTDGKTVSASKKISDIIGAIRSDDAGKTKNLGTNVI